MPNLGQIFLIFFIRLWQPKQLPVGVATEKHTHCHTHTCLITLDWFLGIYILNSSLVGPLISF